MTWLLGCLPVIRESVKWIELLGKQIETITQNKSVHSKHFLCGHMKSTL